MECSSNSPPRTRLKSPRAALCAFAGAILGACYGEYIPLGERCGDGQVTVPEACDDANSIDGDGCNNDCTPAARELWTRCIESFPHPDVRAAGVAFDSLGEPVLVATIVSQEGGRTQVWTRNFDGDGAVEWTSPCCSDVDVDFVAEAAAMTENDEVVAGGRLSGEGLVDGSLLFVLGGDGALRHIDSHVDQEPVAAIAAVVDDPIYALVQRAEGPILLGRGSSPWRRPVEQASPGEFLGRALTLIDGTDLYAAGVIENGSPSQCGWLGRYSSASGQFRWQSEDGGGRYADIAIAPSGDVVYVLAETPCSGDVKSTVHRFRTDGLQSSSVEFPAPRLARPAVGLAVDGVGRLTLLTGAAEETSLTRLAPDGSTLWTVPVHGLAAQALAVSDDGHIAVGGIIQKESRVDVCLRLHTP